MAAVTGESGDVAPWEPGMLPPPLSRIDTTTDPPGTQSDSAGSPGNGPESARDPYELRRNKRVRVEPEYPDKQLYALASICRQRHCLRTQCKIRRMPAGIRRIPPDRVRNSLGSSGIRRIVFGLARSLHGSAGIRRNPPGIRRIVLGIRRISAGIRRISAGIRPKSAGLFWGSAGYPPESAGYPPESAG